MAHVASINVEINLDEVSESARWLAFDSNGTLCAFEARPVWREMDLQWDDGGERTDGCAWWTLNGPDPELRVIANASETLTQIRH